jgi:hypothetical protein
MTPPLTGPGGYGSTMSDTSDLPLPTASSTRSGLSLSYPSMTSRALSPNMPGHQGPSAGLDDLRGSAMHHHSSHILSASANPQHVPHQQWQPTGYSPYGTTPGPTTGLPQLHQSRSWELPHSYLEQSVTGPSSGQLSAYRSTAVERTEDHGADQDDPQQQRTTSGYAAQHHQHHQHHHHHQPTSRSQ